MLTQMCTPTRLAPDPLDARIECDLLGPTEIPASARYGVHTVRALENFPCVGRTIADVPEFLRAFGLAKLSAARANRECGLLDAMLADAIEQAASELAGGLQGICDELQLPLLQGGAGTSTNMSVNEVVANRALEILGLPRGSYEHCHPNDHVNRSQSSGDVYVTALRTAIILRDRELVRPAVETLLLSLRSAAQRFEGVSKLGRIQLQDGGPMTVDQEIDAWADGVAIGLACLTTACEPLHEVNLGGTATGIGMTAPDGYRERVMTHLVSLSGLDLRAAPRAVSATADGTALLAMSAALRASAITMAKVANDLRLLSSGPRTGLAEYCLPAAQESSSAMPGAIRPVVPEFVNQVAFRVRGLDATVAMALDAAQLQLNAMLPVVAEAIFEGQDLIAAAACVFAKRCVDGLDVNEQLMGEFSRRGPGAATEFAAASASYATTTKLVRVAATQRSVHGAGKPPA